MYESGLAKAANTDLICFHAEGVLSYVGCRKERERERESSVVHSMTTNNDRCHIKMSPP